MGVAFGKFIPNAQYEQFVEMSATPVSESQPLSVRTTAGERLEASGGVQINDRIADLGEAEVSVFGITYPEYEAVFPEHVVSYHDKFRSG